MVQAMSMSKKKNYLHYQKNEDSFKFKDFQNYSQKLKLKKQSFSLLDEVPIQNISSKNINSEKIKKILNKRIKRNDFEQ